MEVRMKVRSAVVLVGVSALALGALAASPAQAYDKKSYRYAASHMIDRKDIPAELGAFKKSMSFNAFGSRGKATLCSLPGGATTPGTEVTYPGGKLHFEANYSTRGDSPQSLWVAVEQYPDSQKAIAAFDEAKKEAKKCTGTSTSSWTDPDSGVVSTYTVMIENGVVPSVTTTGVESLFVNVNSDSSATSEEAPYRSDTYAVVSLINNVVISTNYSTSATLNIPTQQRKSINQVAFNAETAWLG
jgi:hypothetical protein